MSDLKKYIAERKKTDKKFAAGYNEGYGQFKVGVMLRQARETAGLTQEELAKRLHTKKTAISRIENHAEDIKLSTLERVASALGKRLLLDNPLVLKVLVNSRRTRTVMKGVAHGEPVCNMGRTSLFGVLPFLFMIG